MTKKFAMSELVQLYNCETGELTTEHKVVLVEKFSTKEEAIGAEYIRLKKDFPTTEGWTGHDVAAIEIQ